MKYLLLSLILLAPVIKNDNEPRPKIDSPLSNIDIINQHLQDNYNCNLGSKFNIIMTGETVEESDKLIKSKTYTDFKIEF
jgi:hypothetical protein